MASMFHGKHQPSLVPPARSGAGARDDLSSVRGITLEDRHLAVRRLNVFRTEGALRRPYAFSSTKRESFGHRLVLFVRMEYLLRELVGLRFFGVKQIPLFGHFPLTTL